MGTRGLVGFYSNGKTKAMYNHYDSYIDGLGADVIKFLRTIRLDTLKDIVSKIKMVKEDSKPSSKQITECKIEGTVDLNVGTQKETDWYCLLRNTQGNLFAYAKGFPYMLDAQEFIKDSLFCEYAYIVNIDTNELEVYVGFQKTKQPVKINRYMKGAKSERGYYPCHLLTKLSFEQITSALTDEEVVATLQAIEEIYEKKRNPEQEAL